MNLCALVAVMALSAPPTQISPAGQEALRPQINLSGTEVAWEVQKRGGRLVRLYNLRRKTTTNVGPNDRPVRGFSWTGSPSRPLFNVLTNDGRWALWIKNSEPSSPSAASDLHGALSPDGKTIAFISGRTGNGDVYLASPKRTNQSPRRLTHTPALELQPRWDPLGNRLAFLRAGRRGRTLVVLSGTRSGDRPSEQVVADKQDNPLSASWRPDGQMLAFYGREWGVGTALYITSPTQGGARKVLNDIHPQKQGPAWISDPRGGHAIVVIRADDQIVAVHPDKGEKVLNTGTYGNGELAARTIRGKRTLALTALGLKSQAGTQRYRKLYLWTW